MMSKLARVWVARFLIPFFIFSLYPQKKSEAIIPLVAPLSIALLDAAGAVVTADALAAVGTALLGGFMFGLIFLTPGDTSNVNGQVRVPTTTAAGSASAMAAIAPSAPSSAAVITKFDLPTCCGYSGTFPYFDGTSAAMAFCTYQGRPASAGWTGVYTPATNAYSCTGNGTYSNDSLFQAQRQTTCPAGYSGSNGTTCTTLTNARAAAPDQKADFTRSGTTLAPYAGDDSGNLKAVVSTTTNPNDTVTVAALDSTTSFPRRISVQATADGGSKVLVQT